MDLSKAFDCLPHTLLIAKLHAYGINKQSLNLLRNYLQNRMQRVKLGNVFSEWTEISLGVPQRSILGPLLFNIFINDLLMFVEKTQICNFADDNTIYSCGDSSETVTEWLKHDLDIVINWFKINELVANPSKFQFMILGGNDSKVPLKTSDITIAQSTSVKLLGITIDQHLDFKLHINSLCKSSSNKVKCLYRIRKYIDVSQAKLLFNAYIMSSFNYCPINWMFCSKSLNTQINKIHKRGLKAIYREEELSFDQLLTIDNGITVHTKNLITLLVKVFKTLAGLNPSFMANIFIPKHTNYNLRSANLLEIPKARSITYGTNSFTFQASLLWNSLPDDIKNETSVIKFKRKLISWGRIRCTCKICK